MTSALKLTPDIKQTPLVKQLAANDRPTRDAALVSLRTYLSGRHDLTPLDYLKIWKGLFYSLWMCDRPRPQAALCAELAALVAVLPPPARIPFLRAFWQTMAREWTSIDVLRVEKFLLLVRRYVRAMFGLMVSAAWEEGLVAELLALLEEVPLEPQNERLPNGIRYHVIDVYIDELEQVGALKDAGEGVPLEELLRPLTKLGKESPTRDVRRKCKDALEDERLPGNEKEVQEEEVDEGVEEEEEEWGGIED